MVKKLRARVGRVGSAAKRGERGRERERGARRSERKKEASRRCVCVCVCTRIIMHARARVCMHESCTHPLPNRAARRFLSLFPFLFPLLFPLSYASPCIFFHFLSSFFSRIDLHAFDFSLSWNGERRREEGDKKIRVRSEKKKRTTKRESVKVPKSSVKALEFAVEEKGRRR